ncbi:MAG: hypothetical protein ACXWWG_00505 [Nitrospira sp.]
MKLSVTPDHAGFDPEAHLLAIKVKLNGELVRNVIAFDTDKNLLVTMGPPNQIGDPREVMTFGDITVHDFDTDKLLATSVKEPT